MTATSFAAHAAAVLCALALLAAPSTHAQDAPPSQTATELGADSFGVAADLPVYMQEWHIWWGFPYPDQTQQIRHMDTRMVADRDPWRLHWNRSGFPYPGLYDSNNPDIVRWQMRCLKAAGVDAAAVMIHPEISEGLQFIQERGGFLTKMLDIAAEEDYRLFFMDEVAFRPKDSPCRDPQVMADRVIRFIGEYGTHPGFLRIDDKPVYYYQTWGYWQGKEATEAMITKVEAAVGPVYWMIFGDIARIQDVEGVDAVISSASNHRYDAQTRVWDPSVQDPAPRIALGRATGKAIGDMIYPKFDGTAQPWRQKSVRVYGKRGGTLAQTVQATVAAKPDFLMLSSWNDWEEGANFEPGWDFDGFTGDPFLYCRVLAHLRGKTFEAPPAPPKSAVHPTIWEKLGHGDGAGPIIDEVYRAHTRGGALEVVVRDTMSPVTDLEVIWDGDASWMAAQPGQDADTGNIKLIEGELGPPMAVESPMGPAQVGLARELPSVPVRFALPGGAELLGPQPHIAAITAFDRLQPLGGVVVTMTARDAIDLVEPMGGTTQEFDIKLRAANHGRDLHAAHWEGWQAVEAQTPYRLAADGAGREFSVIGHGQRLAAISFLGPPRDDLILKATPQLDDPSGLRVRYRFPLPAHVLDEPGLHMLWVRARDKAGNWGSPRLVALPNYEGPWAEYQTKHVEALDRPGAALADPMNETRQWKAVGGSRARQTQLHRVVVSNVMRLGNGASYRELDQPIEGSFTLSLDLLHERFQRGFIAWMTDASGKRGYGFIWDGASASQFDAEGRVAIVKVDGDQPLDWATKGKPISGWAQSGHPATTRPLAQFELKRDSDGVITLSVDGKAVCTARDEQFSSFGRLYLRGNNFQLVDNVVVTPGAADDKAAE